MGDGSRPSQDKGARVLLAFASLVIVIAGLKAAKTLILPFLISAFLALVTLPLMTWLRDKKIPTGFSVLITLLVVVAVLVGIGTLVGDAISAFTAEAPRYREQLVGMTDQVQGWLEEKGLTLPERVSADLINPGQALDVVTGTLRGVAGVLSNLLMVFLIIVFILFEAAGFPAKLQVAFGHRESSRRYDKIRTEIQRYLQAKTLISLTTGGLVGIAMAIIGVDFPLLWGSLAFFLNYIPNLGSIIAAVPPVILAMVQLGPGHALAVAAVFVAVNVTLGNLVEPHIMGRRMGLSTLVVFLSLVFWGWVWGPVGMLLSVPLTMIMRIMLENTEDLRWIAVLLGPTPKIEAPPAKKTKALGQTS